MLLQSIPMPCSFELLRRYMSSVLTHCSTIIWSPEKKHSGILTIEDSRTQRSYKVPINHNAIRATDLRVISTCGSTSSLNEHWESGLRVFDPGFRNTAVVESSVTYV